MVTRGPKWCRDLWVANMQSQLSLWERKNLKTKKKEQSLVQWNLKPIELWEIVAPREAIPEICHYNGIPGDGKQFHHERLEKLAKWMRRLSGLKKIPLYDNKKLKIVPNRLVFRQGMSHYGIGYKDDDQKDYSWGYNQEGL